MRSCMHAQGELAYTMEGARGSDRKGPAFTREELRALFRLDTGTPCETARIMAQSAPAPGDWQACAHACTVHAMPVGARHVCLGQGGWG